LKKEARNGKWNQTGSGLNRPDFQRAGGKTPFANETLAEPACFGKEGSNWKQVQPRGTVGLTPERETSTEREADTRKARGGGHRWGYGSEQEVPRPRPSGRKKLKERGGKSWGTGGGIRTVPKTTEGSKCRWLQGNQQTQNVGKKTQPGGGGLKNQNVSGKHKRGTDIEKSPEPGRKREETA